MYIYIYKFFWLLSYCYHMALLPASLRTLNTESKYILVSHFHCFEQTFPFKLTGSSWITRHKSPSLLRVPNPFSEDPTKNNLLSEGKKSFKKFKLASGGILKMNIKYLLPNIQSHNILGKICWISLWSIVRQNSFLFKSRLCCWHAWNNSSTCWLSFTCTK